MAKHKFEVGQPVWFKLGFHRSELTEGEVTKVGRKYVTVNGQMQFDVETLREKVNYGAEGELYLTKEDYENEVELKQNLITIRNLVQGYGKQKITIEQTRRILEILKPESK